MSCNGCGRPVDSPRPYHCPESHYVRQENADPTDAARRFNASAELVKWRTWAMRLLGCSEAYRDDDEDLRNQINAAPAPPADADRLRRDLRLAIRDVPPGGASADAPAWIVRLHRAACEVAGIGVREAVDAPGTVGMHLAAYLNSVEGQEQFRRDTEGKPPAAPSAVHGEAISPTPGDAARSLNSGAHRLLHQLLDGHERHLAAVLGLPLGAMSMTAMIASVADLRAPVQASEPPETPHPHDATCSRCRSRLVFSARQRGDGLCNPCSRKMGAAADRAEFLAGAATSTPTLADRCRDAGIEPSLVLEILASPEGRAAIAEALRRPPVRQSDGTWREPTPGGEARAGDVVRCPATGQGGKVYRIDGENLWLYVEGGGFETIRAADVEVIVPAETTPAIRQPLAKARQSTPTSAAAVPPLRPGDTWRDPQGTEYVVVPAAEVGDRPRWLVGERTTPHHLSGLRTRADLHRKPPAYHPYALVQVAPPVDAASTIPPGSVGIAFAAYLRSPEAREVLGLTPDPRIGRLARLNTERRTVARVVAIEAGGALRLREDGWDPVMQDYRTRPDDVEWVDEVVA